MPLPDPRKRLKQLAGRLVPDPLDALGKARDLLADTPVLGGAGATPRTLFNTTRASYRHIADPLRAAALEAYDEAGPAGLVQTFQPGGLPQLGVRLGRGIAKEEGTPLQRAEAYGGGFRNRPDSVEKLLVETAIDPLNAIGVVGKGAIAKNLLRELALPVAGVAVGEATARLTGNEDKAQAFRTAGLLTGAFGPTVAAGPLALARKALRDGVSVTDVEPAARVGARAGVGVPMGAAGIVPSGTPPRLGSYEAPDTVNPNRSYERKLVNAAGREVGDDDYIWVYHATTPEWAQRFVREGIQPGTKVRKPPTIIDSEIVAKMLRKNIGDPLDYEPGRGVGDGFYVDVNPRKLQAFGDTVIGVRVKVSDLQAPPERARMHPRAALIVGDGYLTRPVGAEDIRLYDPQSQSLVVPPGAAGTPGGLLPATPPRRGQAASGDEYTPQRLNQVYERVTGDRIKEVRRRTTDKVVPRLASKNTDLGAMRTLFDETWAEGVRLLNESKVVATGIDPVAAAALADGRGFTNKLNALDLPGEAATATRKRVGRARVSDAQAADFVRREAYADRMALGSTQAVNAKGVREPGAVNRMYAYVTAGPPLVSESSPAVYLVWDDATPRVTSVHHHYGLGSPDADIHLAKTPEKLREAMWGSDAVKGGARQKTPTGDQLVGWESAGIDVGGGRKIADTPWLVGPSGENDMRMATLLLGMPKDIADAVRRGEISDPRTLAAVLLSEAGPQHQPALLAAKAMSRRALTPAERQGMRMAATENRVRTESLVTDPRGENIKAIYLVGVPEDLAKPMAASAPAGSRKPRTRLQLAQGIRQRILEETGKDVPIVFKDVTPELVEGQVSLPSKLISDAVVLEGPPITLAPGRGEIVNRYMAAGFPDLGLLPPGTPTSGLTGPIVRAAPGPFRVGTPEQQARVAAAAGLKPETALDRFLAEHLTGQPLASTAGIGLGGAAGFNADEDATPLERARNTLLGAGLGYAGARGVSAIPTSQRLADAAAQARRVKIGPFDRVWPGVDPLLGPAMQQGPRAALEQAGIKITPEMEQWAHMGAPSTPRALREASVAPPANTTRMYHGTGSQFESFDPKVGDSDALYGRGVYLTDDPRVAGDYGDVRAQSYERKALQDDIAGHKAFVEMWSDPMRPGPGTPESRAIKLQEVREAIARMEGTLAKMAGPNIRPIDVPSDLRLFDVDATYTRDEVEELLANAPDDWYSDARQWHGAMKRTGKTEFTGDEVYRLFGDKTDANNFLAVQGYDGLRYEGGRRTPMRDDDGKPIIHNVMVLFPDAVPKMTNALAGTPGGMVAQPGGVPMGANAFLGRAQTPRQPIPPPMPPTPPVQQAVSRGIFSTLMSVGREITLAGDIGQWWRAAVLGTLQGASENPLAVKQGVGALAAGLKAMADVTDRSTSVFKATDPDYARFGPWLERQSVAQGGSSAQGGVLLGWAGKVPVLKYPAALWTGVDASVVDRFVPVFLTKVAALTADGLAKTRAGKQVAADARAAGIPPQQAIDAWVGSRLRNLVIGVPSDPNAQGVWKTANDAADQLLFVSGNRIRGEARNVGKAAFDFSTPEGHMARRFWAAAALTSVATSVGLTAAMTGKDPQDLLDPRHPDSVVNPANPSRFLAVELWTGDVISPFQAIRPMARLLLTPPAKAAGKAYEVHQQGMLASMAVFVDTLLQEEANEVGRFAGNRLALPARLFNDVVLFNEDFFDRPIMTADRTTGRLAQAGRYAASAAAPSFFQEFTQREDPAVPGAEPTGREKGIDTAISWALNLNTTRPPNLPKETDAALRAAIVAGGGSPGKDPLKMWQQMAPSLPLAQRATVEREHPEIQTYLDARANVRSESLDRPQGRKAVQSYDTVSRIARSERDTSLQALEGAQKAQGFSGDEYRRQRKQILADYASTQRGLRVSLFQSADPNVVDAARKAAGYPQSKNDDPLRETLDKYYDIQPADESLAAQDEFFDRRRAFLDAMPAAEREAFRTYRLERARAISETEYQYTLAAERRGEIFDTMPQYRGIKVEDQREIGRLLGRAQSRQKLYGGRLTLRAAIFRDDDADRRIKSLAASTLGGKRSNPVRRKALSTPDQMKFYGSLPGDELAAFVQANPQPQTLMQARAQQQQQARSA